MKKAFVGLSLVLLSASLAAAQGNAQVTISVGGLRNLKGQVLVCLTANPKIWPDCSKDPNAQKRSVSAGNASSIIFSDVAPGTYAVSLVHDENGNGKLDTRVMIPKEGFGFSRNPTVTFGPPKFSSSKFSVGADGASQSIKMKYMF